MLRTRVDGEFDDIVAETIDALEDEGFGVLCDIDVRETLQKKLNEDFRQYRILGACNPQLAHQGLEEDLELGTLLRATSSSTTMTTATSSSARSTRNV